MKKELKERFPKWIKEQGANPLILSDDIDSLMSYIFLRDNFNCKVRYFYDSNGENFTHKLYKQKGFDYKLYGKKAIAVDLALESCKCWDNHVVKYATDDTYNKNSANLNVIDNICNYNYTEKWCVSTYITILAYYNVDIKSWTREQLAILCAIDGLYYPFKNNYSSKIDFKSIATEHLEQLDYEFLANFIEDNLDYIEKLKKDLNLDSKIKIVNGKFTTNIKLDKLSKIFNTDISLPKGLFELKQTLHKQFKNDLPKNYLKENNCEGKKMRNFALVKRYKVVYSY